MHLNLVEQFERALGAILARVRVSGAAAPSAIAVAYSGGLDSSVLLHLMRDRVAGAGSNLFAFHIHHGLSSNADDWLAHCSREAARLGVSFDARRVDVRNHGKTGIEEAARLSRYAALGNLCREHDVSLLLTAHHLDDQAETVLLQLLRGSGVAGLSGMEEFSAAPDLFGDADVRIGRPLLAVSREALEQFAAARQIAFIDDESNADTRYARNALRHRVMPALGQYFPGFQERFARSAGHARSAQVVLDDVAERDFQLCAEGEYLNIKELLGLSSQRIDNLLRYWFHLRGLRMPSTAWLEELHAQLLDADDETQMCVTHPACHVRCYRGRLMLTAKSALDISGAMPHAFRWKGESFLEFAEFGGSLHFDSIEAHDASKGIDAEWLGAQMLTLRLRKGGERLKLAVDRPSRTLKQHYQALGIPAWERERLPLLFAGDDLLFAAGIGADCRLGGGAAARRIHLRWQGHFA